VRSRPRSKVAKLRGVQDYRDQHTWALRNRRVTSSAVRNVAVLYLGAMSRTEIKKVSAQRVSRWRYFIIQ
jgi:hypothetical protein